MRNNRIINMRTPRKDKDAATKKYVDEIGKIDSSNNAIDFHNRRISNIADPIHIDDAVTRKYLDEHYVERTTEGDIDMGDKRIVNIQDPEEDKDAVTKKYVDYTHAELVEFNKSANHTDFISPNGAANYIFPPHSTIIGMYCIFWKVENFENNEDKRIRFELKNVSVTSNPNNSHDIHLWRPSSAIPSAPRIKTYINFTIGSGDVEVYLDNLNIRLPNNIAFTTISLYEATDYKVKLFLHTKTNLNSYQSFITPYSIEHGEGLEE